MLACGHEVRGDISNDNERRIRWELDCEHSGQLSHDGCGVLYLLLSAAFSEGLLSLLSSISALVSSRITS